MIRDPTHSEHVAAFHWIRSVLTAAPTPAPPSHDEKRESIVATLVRVFPFGWILVAKNEKKHTFSCRCPRYTLTQCHLTKKKDNREAHRAVCRALQIDTAVHLMAAGTGPVKPIAGGWTRAHHSTTRQQMENSSLRYVESTPSLHSPAPAMPPQHLVEDSSYSRLTTHRHLQPEP